MSLTVKFWGVRGSLPSSLSPQGWASHIEQVVRDFASGSNKNSSDVTKFMSSQDVTNLGGYGTGTTCVEIKSLKTQLIIDGGTSIRSLSEKIMSGTYVPVKGPFHIYMTHFHWDHVMGLPFFTPHFISGTQIHYYGVQKDIEALIRGIFRKPYFPVPFEQLAAKIHFHILEPRKPLQINDMTITPFLLDHPDPCWGVKVESQGKSYSHCVDTEGTRVSRDELGDDLKLYQNTDVMYFDAQYTFPELAEKANWGHSAAQIGLDLAFREGIKKVLFAHHDPGATIQQVLDIKRQTNEYYQWRIDHAKECNEKIPEIDWDFAYEGLEIKI
jgi:phosphoribosyl 1,2-cyclic phosphodiesterase